MNFSVWKEYGMFRPGDRVLCAVSGGADSMCMLHLLLSRRESLGIELAAAHYEHGLRGGEALRDAEFVRAWCAEQGLPCLIEHGDVRSYCRKHGMSEEEAARELRYAFLQKAAAELGCARIATAHNADDNGETLILNLTRGSGARGLRGIPPVRGNVIRPLIRCTRAEIEAYLIENHIPHVEDSSNSGDDYSRNLIRHRVIPVLRELNPAFSAAAGRTAELLREDESCLESMAGDFVEKYFDGESLPLKEFRALHPALASRVLRALCPKSLSMENVRSAMALAGGSGLAWADLPGIRLRREQGRLYFGSHRAEKLPELRLDPGGSLRLGGAGLLIRAEQVIYGGEINDLFKTYFFKYENICGSIICGGRRPGDRLRLQGRGCTKSLKSLFREAGLTQRARELSPVFRDGAGVLAVYGLGIAERAAPDVGDMALRIDIEKGLTGEDRIYGERH